VTGRARGVLAGVVALQLVAETALTPYWPLLFRTLFGVDDLAATGRYLTVCRVAGLVAMPLWALAALRWSVARLLVAGLLASAVFDVGLALAPDLVSFTALSAGVVASGSSLVLAYPALVALVERDGKTGRLGAVVTFSAVFHASAVLATVLGAGITALPNPRVGLAAFAVVDLALAVLVLRWVPVQPARGAGTTGDIPAVPNRDVRRVGLVVAAVVLVDAGLAVPRPFFVELLVRDGVSLGTAGLLFLLPAGAALAVLPVTARLHQCLGRGLLPVACGLSAAGLLVQAATAATTGDLVALAAGRVLFGVGLGLLLVALDLAVFSAVGTAGPGFTAVESGRSAALLAAPLLATAVAGTWLGLPLLVGALLLIVAGALPLPAHTRPDPIHDLEAPDALEPVR
jgi:hypothetical protein